MSAELDHSEYKRNENESMYDKVVSYFSNRMEKKNPAKATQVQRGKRPLKMPKNYDFSVKNVDFDSYNKDYLLRTDAIWEKSKLYDVFYTMYKREIAYEPLN